MIRTSVARRRALALVPFRSADARIVRVGKWSFCALLALLFGMSGSLGHAAPLPQSNLLTYLRADIGVSTTGTEVTSWADQATSVGGANDANRITAGRGPQFATGMAGLPTLRFDGSNDYLRIAGNSAFDSDEFTWFMVTQADAVPTSGAGVILRSNYDSGAGSGSNRIWGTYISSLTGGVLTSHSRASGSPLVGSNNTATATPALISADWAADDSVTQWLNGTADPVNSGATATPTGHNWTLVGADSSSSTGSGNYYDGDISEIIIYNGSLLQADRQLVENNLAAKYSGTSGANIVPLSNELYVGDDATKGNYDHDVFGIGREADGTVSSRSDDLGLTLSENTSGAGGLGLGEYALAGRAITSSDIVTTDMAVEGSRWEQSWYVDTTGSFDGTLTFDFSDAGVAFDSGITDLLFRANESDPFTFISTAGLISGDQVSFNLLLSNATDGYYTLGYQVPEPSSLVLLSLALVGFARRKRRPSQAGQRNRA